MKKTGIAISVIILVLIVIFGIRFFSGKEDAWVCQGGQWVKHGNPSAAMPTEGCGPAGGESLQTTSDGTITFARPADFALAVSEEQILTHSYIPPCDSGFNYCLYFNSNKYQDTNFESAGLSIKKRPDLKTKNACLNTFPAGYSNNTGFLHEATATSSDYVTSAFWPLSNAAAGHFGTGQLYRLSDAGKCYEFETRIGESDFSNYPAGAIKKFTDADKADVQAELQRLLLNIKLNSTGKPVAFPSVTE